MDGKIRARLINWGLWLNHDAEIAPPDARCISIESRHIPDAGDVWQDSPTSDPVPDVPDAEEVQRAVSTLDRMEQYCLARRYGGISSLFRYMRMSDHALNKMADNAEILVSGMIKKSIDKR